MRKKMLRLVLTALLCFCGLTLNNVNAQETGGSRPKLVVFIVVDQMTPGHLTRFAGLYQHGLARFIKDGAIFSDGHQHHGVTVTGPGHATLATGVFPSRNGIVENTWFDRTTKQRIYCSEDANSPILGYSDQKPTDGRSARNMTFPALGDWLKSKSPQSKVFAAARKDRSAILMAGKEADGAYWYNGDDGNMVTSKFYADSYPDWVSAFNQSRVVDQYFEDGWQKLMPESAYAIAREDSFPGEPANGTFPYSFKERSPKPDKAYYGKLESTPFSDELVLKFARALIDNEELGMDAATDILYIGCDAADGVGHSYGPLSQESTDLFFRLDGYLGTFFDYLDRKIGPNNYVVALSSDHGVLPLPEALQRRWVDAARIATADFRSEVMAVVDTVSKQLGLPEGIIRRASSYYLSVDYEMARENGVSGEQIRKLLRTNLSQIPTIAGIYFREEFLQGNQNPNDPYWQRFANSFQADKGYDVWFRLKKYHIVRSATGTTHGSAYDYDSHVPIAFFGAGIKSTTYGGRVRTVDVAPTLAEIMGIDPPAGIDGESLLGIMRAEW